MHSSHVFGKKYKRGSKWSEPELLELLQIWSDMSVQIELVTHLRIQDVFNKRIAITLQQKGINRTGDQCRDKIKKFKFEYKQKTSRSVRYSELMERAKRNRSAATSGSTLGLWGGTVANQVIGPQGSEAPGHPPRAGENTEEQAEMHGASTQRGASSSAQSYSENAEVFTPELLQRDVDKQKKTYRFVCPHAGHFQCTLTNLVFVMEGEGEVLYKTVSWDPRLLDGLGQMQPAGPLYNIDCFHGSISRLHLPHCEISKENKDGLAVARLTGGNIAIIQPLQVTETHVMIDIRDLSMFGIFKRMIFPLSPVTAQVLIFLRPINAGKKENIMDVHLLPWSVPLSEVKDQHAENTHIKTSSKCSLTPGTEYSLCCQPEGSIVQPETDMFECNFGPNYHATFEVFVNVNIEEVKLSLLDKTNGKEVWLPRRILLTGKSGQDVESPAHRRLTECEFVKKHRNELIQRVLSEMAIADGLRTKDMIPDDMYSKVCAEKTRQEKTRLLLDVFDSGGASVKSEFYRLLKEKEPYLVGDLEPGPSGQQ